MAWKVPSRSVIGGPRVTIGGAPGYSDEEPPLSTNPSWIRATCRRGRQMVTLGFRFPVCLEVELPEPNGVGEGIVGLGLCPAAAARDLLLGMRIGRRGNNDYKCYHGPNKSFHVCIFLRLAHIVKARSYTPTGTYYLKNNDVECQRCKMSGSAYFAGKVEDIEEYLMLSVKSGRGRHARRTHVGNTYSVVSCANRCSDGKTAATSTRRRQ